jgi:hypothetical protein
MNEPFGQADCDSEVRSLKADYRELYFDETPFNEAALKALCAEGPHGLQPESSGYRAA